MLCATQNRIVLADTHGVAQETRVLERDELQSLFEERWEILHDSIVGDGDHGRTLIQFIARSK